MKILLSSKLLGAMCLILLLNDAILFGQGNTTRVDKPGSFEKLLSHDQTDKWLFQGKKDQTITATVDTESFDAVLQLIVIQNGEEKELRTNDSPGTSCTISMRLPENGEYQLRVHGFENSGGGKYQFVLRILNTIPLPIDQLHAGRFDKLGKAHFFVLLDNPRYLTADPKGDSIAHTQISDPTGAGIQPWSNMYWLEQAGEYLVELSGEANNSFEFALRPVQQLRWEGNAKQELVLDDHSGCVIDIVGRTGEFRLIEAESSGDFLTELVRQPRAAETENRLDLQDQEKENRPAFLPINQKGEASRQAVIWNEDEVLQFKLFARRKSTIRCSSQATLQPFPQQEIAQGNIAIGSTCFYGLDTNAGQSLSFELSSDSFDPVLRLFDERGEEIANNDDAGTGNNSRIEHLTTRSHRLIVSVSSVGFGGGGTFELKINKNTPKLFELGTLETGKLGSNGTTHWTIRGKKNQVVIFQVHAEESTPSLSLRNSAGTLQVAPGGSSPSDAILLFRFPEEGDFLLQLKMQREGEFKLQSRPAD